MLNSPFLSFQGEHVRIVSCFERNGQFFGCRHTVERFRGENALGETVWVEPEKCLQGFAEELVLAAAENSTAYQERLKALYDEFPQALEKPLIVNVFGVGSDYL